MSRYSGLPAVLAFLPIGALLAQAGPPCAQHARDCPMPRPIEVGPAIPRQPPPSDAIVLFGGRDLLEWRSTDGGAALWQIGKGYMEIVPGTGAIHTERAFGDVQLHVEWSAPFPPEGKDQDRGNSGVFLMGRYEIQVLDSYANVTYPDGQAAAVYGQYPPLVDPTRPAGEWQTYDIVFRRPRFGDAGELLMPATITLFYNGVLVQDHVTLTGPTGHRQRPPYAAHPDRLPISLQDHAHPVRYRNIWVRDLEK